MRANSPPDATLCNGSNCSPLLAVNNNSIDLAPNGKSSSLSSMKKRISPFSIPKSTISARSCLAITSAFSRRIEINAAKAVFATFSFSANCCSKAPCSQTSDSSSSKRCCAFSS